MHDAEGDGDLDEDLKGEEESRQGVERVGSGVSDGEGPPLASEKEPCESVVDHPNRSSPVTTDLLS